MRANVPVRVGPGGAVDFVLPGLETAQTIASPDGVRVGVGLEAVALDEQGERGPCLRDAWSREVSTLLVWPSAHPEVELELRAESGVPFTDRGRAALLPTRELAYGLALASCIAGLLVVQQAVSTIRSGGGAAEPGRIERIMMTASPSATFVARPAPVTAVADPVVTPSSSEGVEPVVVALGERSASWKPEVSASDGTRTRPKPAAAVVHSEKPPTRGEHSHTAAGQREPGGADRGPAAEPGAFSCDRPEASPKPNIDVVFVIDVSTTMSFMLRHLSDEIATLDEVVRRHDPEPRYGLVVFVDDVMLVNQGKAYADVDALRRDFEHWAKFTSTNRQLRSDLLNLDWPENSLDALHAAATGFDWRPADDTLRLVVHATDDTFGDGGHWLSGGQVRHGYAQTVGALKDAEVRVASFAARIGGRCECENVEPGFFTTWRGQPSIPDATGGAVFDIDEVASKRLRFADAVTGLVGNTLCD